MVGNDNRDRVADAEARASMWLAAANRKRACGRDDEQEMRKSQFWLDRANRLRGW